MKRYILLIIIAWVLVIGGYDLSIDIKNSRYSINKDLVSQISKDTANYVTIEKMPKDLINAVVSVEDKRFNSHFGFDIRGIIRAALVNLKEGKIVEGGSTITQQLAKNLFLSNERTFKRKIKELFIAIKLEVDYTKEEILEMYLNVIYYGSNAHGIYEGSMTYFNKVPSQLSRKECAMLAGIIKAPSLYNPKVNMTLARKRQSIVLEIMSENHDVDKSRDVVLEY